MSSTPWTVIERSYHPSIRFGMVVSAIFLDPNVSMRRNRERADRITMRIKRQTLFCLHDFHFSPLCHDREKGCWYKKPSDWSIRIYLNWYWFDSHTRDLSRDWEMMGSAKSKILRHKWIHSFFPGYSSRDNGGCKFWNCPDNGTTHDISNK
jgi:hypothetical protein